MKSDEQFKYYLDKNYPEINLNSIEAEAKYIEFLKKKKIVDKMLEPETDKTEEIDEAEILFKELENYKKEKKEKSRKLTL